MTSVSVIIPCYNTHQFLPETLNSLEAQTYQDFETILINDGSTNPDTLSYLKTLPSWVRVVHQNNQGLAAARNTGFREATSDYVLPLDADDWLAPDFIEKTLQALVNNPEAGFVYSQLQMEGDNKGILRKQYNFFEQLFFNQIPYCLLIPKKIWQQIGGYDETMRLGYEDWEFNIRLGIAGYKGIYVPEPLFHYRVSQTGMLKSISQSRHGDLWQYIQSKHQATYHWKNLFQLWKQHRAERSTYPLGFFFIWQALFKILPRPIFTKLFSLLLRFSSSRRISKKSSA